MSGSTTRTGSRATERTGPVRVERTASRDGAPASGGSEVISLIGQRVRVEVLSYGAHLVGVWWPDGDGVMDNSVVSLRRPDGTVDMDAYRERAHNPYMGAMVGRYANRIAGARFDLDGVTHHLAANEGGNQLHGGPEGFDRREWQVTTHSDALGAQVSLRLVSDDGDQGHPGRVEVMATYRLDAAGTLQIDVEGTTDAPTVLNVTNHAYWNLGGTAGGSTAGYRSILDHTLSVAADLVVEVDDALVPTGHLDPVAGTPWDLRTAQRLGEVLGRPEMADPDGMDRCLVLANAGRRRVEAAGAGDDTADPAGAGSSTSEPITSEPSAVLVDTVGGRRLRLYTDQPGLQVYTTNHGAGPSPRHGAVCLESQHLPDSPNQPGFPSATLRPGQVYRHHQLLVLDTVR